MSETSERRGVAVLALVVVLAGVVFVGWGVGTAAAGPTCDGSNDDFAGGDGSSGDPYQIENVEQLQCVGDDAHLDDHFVLIDDIDASGTEDWNEDGGAYLGFDPIGDSGDRFTGTFDGDGHTISALYIDRTDGSNVGLFGHSTGDLSDVSLEGVDIEGDADLNNGVGALAGRSEGAVSDVTMSGTVDGNRRVGGLIGTIRGDGTVSDSSASATVTTGNFAGGLIGEARGSEILRSYASGDVDGDNTVGGLVGWNEGGISESYATGDVDGDSEVGGLVGRNYHNIDDSYWDRGTTNQEDAIGQGFGSSSGLEGFGSTDDTDPADEMTGEDAENNMYRLDFSSTWETVTADDADASDDSYPILTELDREAQLIEQSVWLYAGGKGTVESPYVLETWHHLDSVRENLDANFTLGNDLDESSDGYDNVASENANDGDGFDPIGDSDNEFTGNFDGDGHTISALYIDRGSTNNVGLFGYMKDGQVEHVGVEDVDITGAENVGALLGGLEGLVVQSYATGLVSGAENTGGLVGDNLDGEVSRSFATSDVDGTGRTGGLVGWTRNGGTVIESYATGTVNGDVAGALIGETNFQVSVSDSYATGPTSGTTHSGGLAGYSFETDWVDSFWDKGTTDQGSAFGFDSSNTQTNIRGFGSTSDTAPATKMQGINATVEMHLLDFESTWWVRINPDDYPGLTALEDGLDPNIDNTNHPVIEGETLSVDVTVTNTDATERTQDVTLSVDGEAVDVEEEVTVTGDDSQKIVLNWQTKSGDAGEYDIVVTTADTADVATVQVIETYSVSGTVEDTSYETGIGTIDVTVSGESGDYTAETDENGEYTVENVPGLGESYDVIVDPAGWEKASTTTTVEDEDVVGVDLDITGDASNKVTLRDRITDVPLEDATMAAEHESFGVAAVTTDENGEAEIIIPGGFEYDFTYSKAGYDSFEASDSFGLDDRKIRNYVLGGNAEIAGKITDRRTGEGIGSATVTADKGTGSYEATTEPDGTYTVENVPGGAEYDVAAEVDGYETTTSPDEFVEDERTHSVDLELTGAATVEGTVTDRITDATIENAELTLVYPTGDAFTFEGATDTDGSFAVAELPEIDEEFTLLASATVDEEFRIENETAFNPAQTTSQDLTLGPAYEGDGTEDSPYEIHDVEDLQQMRYNLTVHYELQGDIDASDTSGWFDDGGEPQGFNPIGDDGDKFAGHFDGDGHTVSELYVNRGDDNYIGLFGYVDGDGTVENVGLEDVSVEGSNYVGGLVGVNEGGTVSESYATGSVEGDTWVGGLVGYNFGTVRESYATGSAEGSNYVGGLVGVNDFGGEVRASYAMGGVEGSDFVGGLVGLNSDTVENSYWDVEASGQEDSDGSDDEFGLTTDEMTGLNAIGNMTAFEFPDGDGSWHVTDSYPALAWEDTDPFYEVSIEETNSPIEEGGTLDVIAEVTNWAADGQQSVMLFDFSNEQQGSETVALDSGDATTGTLQWQTQQGDTGTGDVTVESENDTDSVEVTVDSVPERIDAEVTDDEATADGDEEVEFTVTIEDTNGNPIEGVTVEMTDDGGATFATTSNETDADGETIFTATSTDVGEFTVEFSEVDAGSDTATATFVAGAPADVTATAVEDTATADGSDELAFEVTVIDANDNPVEGVEVQTADDGTEIDIDPTSWETDDNGGVTVTATSRHAQDDVEFTFTEQDNDNAGTATGTFETGDPTVIDAEVTVDEAVADGDEEVEFTVTVEDEYGNPVGGSTVDVEDDAGLAFGDESNETDADGQATFTATSTDAGVFIVEFSEDNAGTDTATMTFVAGEPASVSAETVEGTATADGAEELSFEVSVEDANDNPVGGIDVTAVHDGTNIDVDPASAETDDGGEVTFTATSTTAQEDLEFTFTEQENENADTSGGMFVAEEDDDVTVPEDDDESDDESGAEDESEDEADPDDEGDEEQESTVAVEEQVDERTGDRTVRTTITSSNAGSVVRLDNTSTPTGEAIGSLSNTSVDSISMSIAQSREQTSLNITSYEPNITTRNSEDAVDNSSEATGSIGETARNFEETTGSVVAGYVTVEHNFEDGDLDSVSIEYSVRKSHLESLDMTADSISLVHTSDGTEWSELPTEQIGENDTLYRFESEAPSFSVFAINTGADTVTVGDSTLDRKTIDLGKSVTVSTPVKNRGTVTTDQGLTLTVDGETAETRIATVAGGSAETVEMQFEPEDSGEYEIAVNGRILGSVTVEASSDGETDESDGEDPVDTDESDDQQDDQAQSDDGPEASDDGFGPGFGIGAVLVGAVLLTAGAYWRRERLITK